IWPLSHVASVGEYAPLAHAAVDEILEAGRTPLVVGGTGLYFRAALAELELPPAPAPGARERWERLYDDGGPAAAHARLEELDAAAAAQTHPNDRRRVVRTRRYAAYQRKWLRRLEGLVMVAADRPPEETAAEIVALARTRERLSRP